MCYFVEINLSRQELQKRFNVPLIEDPRYMQANLLQAFNKPLLPVISQENPELIGLYRWGLIPSWIKDRESAEKMSTATFNARAEGIFEKPSFRASASRKRCMVLVHGFFEWHHGAQEKTPYYIKRKNDQPFALAGLYNSWTDRESGEILDTVSIITTRANSLMERIHNSRKRMPVILPDSIEKEWIDPGKTEKDLIRYFEPFPEEDLVAWPVKKQKFLYHDDLLDPELVQEERRNIPGDLFSQEG